MGGLSWFRLYAEAVDDEKLRLLAFEDRWHFVAICCCKAQGILDDEDADRRRRKVCVKLGLLDRELDEVARRLSEVGLIHRETFQPVAWDNRQFKSDSSLERVRKYREKMKRYGNVSVTGQETETEAETEKDIGTDYVSTLSESTDSDVPKPINGKTSYRVPDCPYGALVDAYHELLPAAPRIEVLTEQRKRHMQARWRQVCADEKLDRSAGVEWFRAFFSHVGDSKFLTGRVPPREGRKPFVAGLDWLMGAEKFVKVYEGAYHR